MQRHKVKVLEGDQTRETLVPFATVYEFPDHHDGVSYNDAINTMDWAPFQSWVAWHALTFRGEEAREFDEFVKHVEWVELDTVDADPSGGEPTRTSSSPASSAGRRSASRSSTSPTRSKKPSGQKSTAKA